MGVASELSGWVSRGEVAMGVVALDLLGESRELCGGQIVMQELPQSRANGRQASNILAEC